MCLSLLSLGHFFLSGWFIPKNIQNCGQEILVEEHQNDDHNWCHCGDHPHPHHSGCHWYHLKLTSTLTQDRKYHSCATYQNFLQTFFFLDTSPDNNMFPIVMWQTCGWNSFLNTPKINGGWYFFLYKGSNMQMRVYVFYFNTFCCLIACVCIYAVFINVDL